MDDMVTVELDTAYDLDGSGRETVETVIQAFSAKYGVKGTVVNENGPGGGWPVVEWMGKRRNMRDMLVEAYEFDEEDIEFVGL